jgi:lipopolysaccharide transport system permease protein
MRLRGKNTAMSTTPEATDATWIVIRPTKGWTSLRLHEVWQFHELLLFFVWRDVKVRYKQTILGALWAILQPLLTMVVFTIFFGGLARVGSDGLPYPLFSYAGLLPWTFFAFGLSQSANSLVGASNLIKKVYFPRLIIPLAAVLTGLVDFAVSFVVLMGLMAWYRVPLTLMVVWLPVLLLLAVLAALGFGLWFAALNVEYRDVRYVVPFFVQLWLFVTPVIYPTSRLTAKLTELGLPVWLSGLNPMTGVVEGFRWSLLGSGSKPGPILVASAAVTFVLLLSGAYYFRRMERTFADVV